MPDMANPLASIGSGIPQAGPELSPADPIAPEIATEPVPQDEPEVEEADFTSYVIDAKFNDDEQSAVMKLIQREMGRIKVKYDQIGYFDACQKADEEYDGKGSDDDEDESVKLLLTTLTIDIIASRAYRQTWTPSPAAMIEADRPEDHDVDVLSARQRYLDGELKNRAQLQNISLPIYRGAAKYGAQIVATQLAHEVETQTRKKIFSPETITEYEKKHEMKLANPNSKEFKEWDTIKGGKSIQKKETKDVLLYHGARCSVIPYKNFFARPDIKDFRKHTVIAELFTYNWYDIEANVKTGMWDEDPITDIAEAHGDEYMAKDYDFYRAIVQFDRKDDGVAERYLVTFEAKTKKIVRAIYYPFKEIFYTPYVIFEKADSWIGYSVVDRMSDIAATANSVITAFVKEQDLAHTPIIISNGKKVSDWNIKLGQPNLLQLGLDGQIGGSGSTFMQYRLESVSSDRIAFLQWIQSYIAILTGVDPALLSGSQDPADKRAPAAKVGMKMQASTMRIEDMIITLQKGDASVARQIEDICYMFPDKKMEKYLVDKKYDDRDVKYNMAGSRMSFDRAADLQVVMGTIDFMHKFFPDVIQDVEVKKAMLGALLNNSQGTVEKMKDTVLRPMELVIRAKKQQMEQIQKVSEDAKSRGLDPNAFLQSLLGGGKPGGKPPMPPQGQPPQGGPPSPPAVAPQGTQTGVPNV